MSLYYHPEAGELARVENRQDLDVLLGASRSVARSSRHWPMGESPETAGWVLADWQESPDGNFVLVDESGALLWHPGGGSIYATEEVVFG